MSKTLRNKTNGQFAGSVGVGKTKVPAPDFGPSLPSSEASLSDEDRLKATIAAYAAYDLKRDLTEWGYSSLCSQIDRLKGIVDYPYDNSEEEVQYAEDLLQPLLKRREAVWAIREN